MCVCVSFWVGSRERPILELFGAPGGTCQVFIDYDWNRLEAPIGLQKPLRFLPV